MSGSHIARIHASAWDDADRHTLLEELAYRSRLAVRAEHTARRTFDATGDESSPSIEATAYRLDLEAQPAYAVYGDVEATLRSAAPAILRIDQADSTRVLGLLSSRRGRVRLLGPDLMVRSVAVLALAATIRAPLEASHGPAVDDQLARIGIAPRRRARARRALFEEQLATTRTAWCWLLRRQPGASFRSLLAEQGVFRWLVRFLVSYLSAYTLLMASWWALGRGALEGRSVFGWLIAWALLLVTLLPSRAFSVWSQAQLTIGLGSVLKRRLLAGALEMEPGQVRHHGIGQLLGRVIESEAAETLTLQGGFRTAVGLLEALVAVGVLALGAGGLSHALLLVGWLFLTALVASFFLHRREGWTERRLSMTHDLIEGIIGHRTRKIGQPLARRHEGEDDHLAVYLASSQGLDRSRAALVVAMPHAWLVVGTLGFLPAFISAAGSPARLAIAVGGVLAAHRGLLKLSEGFDLLAGAWIGWRSSRGIADAAARYEPATDEGTSATRSTSDRTRSAALLVAHDLCFRHPGRPKPTIRDLDLTIRTGDRILLEGVSGGGKSTLASLLTGLRQPTSGLLLLDGFDRHALGNPRWRRRAVAAPQFHENHVVSETFLFNLLMGRQWPPEPADVEDATEVCRELGLDALLERMPAGLQEIVGETGWQLSHGERSRLFIARTLLQGADLIVLDESLAALDATSFERVLRCLDTRAPSLLIIAHP